ncbi:hypothetical protein [Mucilaginibacter celer]|uniref:hypothetical protein n=1 Tax=Mucilaginibacter celer TaxID=2305508 RepID=UPI003CCA8AD7
MVTFPRNQVVTFPRNRWSVSSEIRWSISANSPDNALRELPSTFQNLQALRILNIDKNQLSSFSDVIMKLKSLRTLNASANGLGIIPAGINQLFRLLNLVIQLTLKNCLHQYGILKSCCI